MKYAFAMVMALLVSAVFISGCTTSPGSQETGSTQGVQMTQSEKETQALNAVETEMEAAIESATLEDLQNELLSQG